ncbi:MAG: ATP-dependent RecD-like DNA helicase [Proteobacteria bacterium]|nr:ATP-dependent RecD-like DNA helicase [Pseudomonadota bacterium]MBU1611804.1 ATP-dependent RecD-like DNA helicase [Pseudomonadota bacterium]
MYNTLTVEIQSVVFLNEDNGYTILRGRSKEEPGTLTLVGTMGRLTPGETVEVSGEWKTHPKFGRQLEVASFTQARPATENGVIKFLASSAIKGIGPAIAERMVEQFGVEVLDVLDTEPEKLIKIRGISKSKLVDIVESWNKQREVKNLIIFLHSHEVPPTYAGKIFHLYGAQSVRKLEENPYELTYHIRGVGFRTADTMALKLGFPSDCHQRIEAAIVYTLFTTSERQGHLFLPKAKLLDEVARMLDGVAFERIETGLEALAEIKRVQIEPAEPDAAEGSEPVYLWHHYRYERESASRLYELASHPRPVSKAKIEIALPEVEQRLGFILSQEQREAVFEACVNKAFIITGGPGTGKTTITRAVVGTLKELGLKVKLAAPTGRAAKRMSEATGEPAQTIHRLLQFAPDGGFQYNEEKKLRTQVLVVDEASMLDAQLFLSVLRALPLTCRLVLVGDVNQLPSVGPGNVLGDLLNSGAIASARLTHIFRQAQESFIVVNAHRINAGQLPRQSPYQPPQADFFWVNQDDPERVRDIIVETVCERIPQRYGLDPMRQVQVLTPMHKGEVGTQELNKVLQERLNPRPAMARNVEIRRGNLLLRVGDRVLQLRNNYDKEVFNGDLGWVEEVDSEAGEVAVDFEGNLVHYETSELDDLTLAYAVSVHKSQGSEYPAIVVPVVTQHFIMLQRNLIYTALTRARDLAVIVGSERAMTIGLKNTTAGRRYTRLAPRIAEAFETRSDK